MFPDSNSFTLTLPGIAGIILAIGMGVDANIITAERIKEELNSGMDLDSAISAGFSRGLTPIVDGNITILIIAVLLMGSFGPTDSIFAKILKPIFLLSALRLPAQFIRSVTHFLLALYLTLFLVLLPQDLCLDLFQNSIGSETKNSMVIGKSETFAAY